MAMLNYSKVILEKVSFDRELFAKELQKSIQFIEEDELSCLKSWCTQKFGHVYPGLLEDVFPDDQTVPDRNKSVNF